MMCRIYRLWLDRSLDDRRPLPALVERHLAGCTSCRRHRESQERLVRRLRAGATTVPTEPSPFLRTRILNEVRADARQAAALPQARLIWAGSVLAVLVLGFVLFRPSRPMVDESALAKAPVSTVPDPAAALLVATTRITDGGRLLQVATNIDQPLQKEMHLVLQDARTVLRSLQTEFVPATLLAQRN